MRSETSLNDSTVVKVCELPKTGSKYGKKHRWQQKPRTAKNLRHKTVPSYGCGSAPLTADNAPKSMGLVQLSAVLTHDLLLSTISFTSTRLVFGHSLEPRVSPDADFGSSVSSACSAWKKEFSSRMTSTSEPPSCDGGGQLVCRRSSWSIRTCGSLSCDFLVRQYCIRWRSTKPSTRYVYHAQNSISSSSRAFIMCKILHM